ncbi:serine/threonine protein kinase, partial [Corallococcus carmarthensis]
PKVEPTPPPAPEALAAPVQEPPPVAAVEEPPPAKPEPPAVKAVAVKTVRDNPAPKRTESASESAVRDQILSTVRQVESSPLYADNKVHKGLTQQAALNYLDKQIKRLENADDSVGRAEILGDLRDWKQRYLK